MSALTDQSTGDRVSHSRSISPKKWSRSLAGDESCVSRPMTIYLSESEDWRVLNWAMLLKSHPASWSASSLTSRDKVS